MKTMIWLMARGVVEMRGLCNRLAGRSDWSGLTVPCDGCPDSSPHDAHLALGALTSLGGRRP